MRNLFGKQNLRTRFFIWSTVIMIGSGMLFSFLYYRHVKQLVMDEALSKSELILQEVEAIREYVKEELRPKMYELEDSDAFIIEAMSSTYVSLDIMRRFGRKMEGYVYRRVSLNPLNPNNRADEWEEGMFDWFEADQTRTFWQGIATRSDGKHFVSIIPDYIEPACLHCHGDPEDAPPVLIDAYGQFGGFRYNKGDLAGINSVSIPVERPLAELKKITLTVFVASLAGGFLLLYLFNLLFGKLVISRLASVMHLLEQEEKSFLEKSTIGNRNKIDEIDSLNESFNYLQRYVKTARKGSHIQPNFIDAYTVGRPIFAGSMSWVYEGFHSTKKKKVLLKIPFDNITVNPLYRACWRSEIQLFRHIDNKYILNMVDVKNDIVVLDDFPSRQEKGICQLQGNFKAFRPIFFQLCDLLASLHTQGIVHHDIRPEIFFLAKGGEVSLVDMGFASCRDIPDTLFESGLGPQGDFRYMAPEQLRGVRGDPRSDIYSLGVVLFLMATGSFPFDNGEFTLRKWKRKKDKFVIPPDISSELPERLVKIIGRAMFAKPSGRYQWVEDFRDDFMAI